MYASRFVSLPTGTDVQAGSRRIRCKAGFGTADRTWILRRALSLREFHLACVLSCRALAKRRALADSDAEPPRVWPWTLPPPRSAQTSALWVLRLKVRARVAANRARLAHARPSLAAAKPLRLSLRSVRLASPFQLHPGWTVHSWEAPPGAAGVRSAHCSAAPASDSAREAAATYQPEDSAGCCPPQSNGGAESAAV